MIQIKSEDEPAEFQTTHITKCFERWCSHWAHYTSLKETILKEQETNKMTSALLMEIFGPNLFDHTTYMHTFSEMLC
jgi:hypothetical protein